MFSALRRCLPGALLAAAAAGSGGAAGPADKSGCTLLSPTPPELLRELSTDRPDQTESPYTVDAGHWQVELDFLKYTVDRDRTGGSDVRTRELAVAPMNLKVGLTNRIDLQFVFDPYVSVKVEDRVAATTGRADGFGDLTTRLKINFWGNDGGPTAFALMPYVKWPLSASSLRNGETEGGIIAILGYELSGGWGSAVMTEIDFVSNGADGHDTEWLNSITFAHDITEKVGGYFEFLVVTGNAAGFKTQGQFDFGFTYAVSDHAQLDLGCNIGLTKAAPDFQPFVGFSRRF